MFKIIWSSHSELQMDQIFNFYQHQASINIAIDIITKIIESTNILKSKPYLGPIEPLLQNRNFTYRYLIYSHYKIIYHVDEINKTIKISDIFDTRQNPSKLDII